MTVSTDGTYLYITNGRGVTGPNPGFTYFNQQDPNQYVYNLEKSYLLSFPVPSDATLQSLTRQVAINDHFRSKLSASDAALMSELHHRIKHVIYLVKENRTYEGFDFSHEDTLYDPVKFNRIIWEGLHAGVPYPTVRSGLDLRKNRTELLNKAKLVAHQVDMASTEETN